MDFLDMAFFFWKTITLQYSHFSFFLYPSQQRLIWDIFLKHVRVFITQLEPRHLKAAYL